MEPATHNPRLQWLRRAFEPLIRPVIHFYWRFSRPVTLGARAVVIDGQGRVFLVKHSYVDGWHLPGGGVEIGETVHEALARELAEEGNIRMMAAPRLHGVFFNTRVSRRDHVAHGFFAPDALPEDTGGGTRARIAEVLGGAAVTELW
jgi:ADP-ribose pyrophosphatase YjhB (NUDIX family)